MVASKPTLRSAPKPVDNSFQAAANSFQPTTVAPNRAETKPEKTSLAPQHDIAKSAALMTDAAPEEPSAVAVSTVDLPSPTEKFAANHAPAEFRASGNSPKTYVAKPGDSFWSIATEQYGDGRLFDALYRWNKRRVKSFDDLPVATELDIPTKIELARRWPDLCPSDQKPSEGQTFGDQTVAVYDAALTERLYTTQEGDTLFEIAAKKLGQASRYVDIMAKNDQRLPSDINHSVPLQPGLRLVLPE
jgi:nucleoid-associated protein YgaU